MTFAARRPFGPPERRLTEQRYQTIEFPFGEFDARMARWPIAMRVGRVE
ncbi:MAG TPA: hypothetical protein VN513_01325 [Gemmatimonadales bacterium]|nr:hypothetical protein [Gemmatimonadales bacterium]